MNYKKDDYYTEITRDEWINFRDDKWIDFNQRDINRLTELSKKFEVIKSNNKNYIKLYHKETWLNILECEDEWFIVSCYNNDNYYKCDQIDGVLYFLKDKGFILTTRKKIIIL